MVGPPRSQADVKDTTWVTARKPLARKVPEDAAEGLLQDGAGCLLEGLVTNLFVVRAMLPLLLLFLSAVRRCGCCCTAVDGGSPCRSNCHGH